MHYPDLTPYTYHPPPEPGSFNVGWLDREYAFRSGPVPAGLVGRLLKLCRQPAKQHRGFHVCPFCDLGADHGIPNQAAYERVKEAGALGSAELRVVGQDDRVYAAPTLIAHYVSVHGYQPPPEFVSAVMALAMGR